MNAFLQHATPRLAAAEQAVNLRQVDIPAPAQLVAINPVWRKIVTQAELVAPYMQTAVIEGESGSGKQTLARFLHTRSPLARTAFQRHDAREWLVHNADPAAITGFLYLDRVDLLASPGQNLLLGVLKALQDRPAGRTIVITGAQTSLRQLSSQGQLLPDLAYRLTAVRFPIPPLRQRKEEIAPLAEQILARLCHRYQQRPVAFAPGALARLLQHDWPGNIRELSSVLEAALLDAANGLIHPEDLTLSMPESVQPAAAPAPPAGMLLLDSVIRRHVEFVLDLNRGNKLRAARQLGISRSTLYRILGNQPYTG
ncbi:MAG: sigma-54-dependent Fis family transcriptional regulator [Acidobacteriota bacterium]|nr:sigma-54-dependent Fis family transcriptional regulator [Acidobacteriota bacterium]